MSERLALTLCLMGTLATDTKVDYEELRWCPHKIICMMTLLSALRTNTDKIERKKLSKILFVIIFHSSHNLHDKSDSFTKYTVWCSWKSILRTPSRHLAQAITKHPSQADSTVTTMNRWTFCSGSQHSSSKTRRERPIGPWNS